MYQIAIPERIINDDEINNLSLFLYTLIKCDRSRMSNIYQTSINGLVEECGFKPNRNAGKINDKMKSILQNLKDIKVIDFSVNIFTITPSKLFKIIFNEKNLYDENMKQFALIEQEQYKKIIELKTNNKSEALRIFLLIKLYMFDYKVGLIAQITLKRLKRYLGFGSVNTVADIVQLLEDNKILYRYVKISPDENFRKSYYSVVPFTEDMQNICEGL